MAQFFGRYLPESGRPMLKLSFVDQLISLTREPLELEQIRQRGLWSAETQIGEGASCKAPQRLTSNVVSKARCETRAQSDDFPYWPEGEIN